MENWEKTVKIEEQKERISIIMPVYNSEKYVSEAIESVCRQSYPCWELLVIDDGSTDGTSDILDDYKKRDSRIKVFHRKNEGVSGARNFALGEAEGEYITFIDSDDLYHADRLRNMWLTFKKYEDCDIVFSRHVEFTGETEAQKETGEGKTEITDCEILKKVISDSKNHFVWNAMLKAEIARKEKFPPMRFAEDFCYIRDCAYHCRKIAVLDETLYFYRRDNENAMTSHFFSEKYVPDYMKLVENIYTFCETHALNSGFYKKMVAHEYAQNCMRIRKSTSYVKFVSCMNDKTFRMGIKFADATQCTLFEKFIFFMVKYKVYVPFAFWIW